ncbi:MAG TPA: LytTR family DNA-binding domain-containing protein [Flavitalea sp.]|nr:LytTR family DNA-binding domain-containing protein [Flavitalea sp.]
MMRCIIVDDEKLALDLLENNISRIPFLKLIGRFTNPFEALGYLQENQVDLIFIDIQMSGITGLEMAAALNSKTQIVFVSAYENYALAGFNLEVTDYLVKPVPYERFLKACIKCHDLFNYRNQGAPPVLERTYFFVNVEYAQVKINLKSIVLIEAMKDYVKITLTDDKPVITRMSLKAIEEKLDSNEFLRVHKSYIVNASMILRVKKGLVVVQGREIPLSENYKEQVSKKLHLSY